MRSHNFAVKGRRFSLRLESEFLSALTDMCYREDILPGDFIAKLSGKNRTSALRVALMQYYKSAANLPPVDLRGTPK